ncbi:MAG: hypothetical protein AB7P97_19265 [Hyphomonadaceae bacterium]
MAGKTFAVEIRRDLSAKDLGWYDEEHESAEQELGGNRRYEDLRAFGWSDVATALEIERDVIAQITALDLTADEEKLGHREEAAWEILEELEAAQDTWSMWGGPLWGLDVGVASAVIAVSAAGCVPFSSCNAGAFGRHHNSTYPNVGFYMRAPTLPTMLACAERAGVSLTPGYDGSALLLAKNVDDLLAFASACYDASEQFDAVAPQAIRD